MKKPGVLKRLGVLGRTQARLAEIVARVGARELSRMDAGDLILEEVVRPLGSGRNPGEKAVLCEAQLLRAQLYEQSGGATPVEAAEALEAAWFLIPDIPEDPLRYVTIGRIAESLIGPLEKIGSRRTVCRMTRLVLEAWSKTGQSAERTLAVLSMLPERIRRLKRTREDPGVMDMLRAAERHGNLKGAEAHVLAVRAAAVEVLVRLGLSREALALEQERESLSATETERLVLLLADGGAVDSQAQTFYRASLQRWPALAPALSASFCRLSHVGAQTAEDRIPSLVALNQILLPHFDQASWPRRHLAAAAIRSGRFNEALAWLATLLDRNGEAADLAIPASGALASFGFFDAAVGLARAGSVDNPMVDVCDALRAAHQLLTAGTDPRQLADLVPRLSAALEMAKAQPVLSARVLEMRARVHQDMSELVEALRDHEGAIQLGGGEPGWALSAADCCLRLSQLERAEVYVNQALSAGRTRAALVVAADLAELRDDFEGSLKMLEEALRLPNQASGPCQELKNRLKQLAACYEQLGSGPAAKSPFLRSLREACRGSDSRGATHEDALRQRAACVARRLRNPRKELEFLAPLALRPGASVRRVAATARIALRAQDHVLLAELLERWREKRGDDPQLAGIEGLVLLRAGRWSDARRLLEMGGEAGGVDTQLALALVHRLEGRWAEALAVLGSLPELPTGDLELLRLDLEALCLEGAGRFDDALVRRGRAMMLGDSPERRRNFGRLAITRALRQDRVDFPVLQDGVRALEDLRDDDSRALWTLGSLVMGRQVQVPGALWTSPQEVPEDVPGLRTALLHHLSRWCAARGDLHSAHALAERISGSTGDALVFALQVHELIGQLPRVLRRPGSEEYVALRHRLEAVPTTPSVQAALELLDRVSGAAVSERSASVEGVLPSLRLALARVGLVSGKPAGVLRTWLGRVLDLDDGRGSEAQVIVAWADPKRSLQDFEAEVLRSRPGAFPTLQTVWLGIRERRDAALQGRTVSGEPLGHPLDGPLQLLDWIRRIRAGLAAQVPAADLRPQVSQLLEALAGTPWSGRHRLEIERAWKGCDGSQVGQTVMMRVTETAPGPSEVSSSVALGLSQAQALMERGEFREAENLLGNLFASSTDDREGARQIIKLLQRARAKRAAPPSQVMALLAAGRYEDVVAGTGGAEPEPDLDGVGTRVRLRALIASGYGARAAQELLAVDTVRVGLSDRELDELQAGVLLASVCADPRSTGHEALRLWGNHENRECRSLVSALADRDPHSVGLPMALGFLLRADGQDAAAQAVFDRVSGGRVLPPFPESLRALVVALKGATP